VVLTGILTATAGDAATHPPGPISVVLLLDASFSMSTEPLADESRFPSAIHAVARALQPGDRALVGAVGRRAVFASAFHGTDKELVADWRQLSALSAADRFGPSPLFDAIEDATAKLRDTSGGRGVVLWTDGRPSGNVHGSADVAADAANARIPIHVIVDEFPWIPTNDKPAWMIEKPCAIFDTIVRTTGGSCTPHQDRRGAATRQLAGILQRLRG
jgi:hypothetical protein